MCPGLSLSGYRGGEEIIKEFNILIAGVGGQGIILISELLGNAAVNDGFNVRGSEVLGMAVRGGPVFSIIRIGSEVYGPLIPPGKGDILIALEPSEALRNITYLSKSSTIILNTEIVIPFTVSLGQSTYPDLDEIVAKLSTISDRIVKLNAGKIAEEAGSPMAANVVMLGASFGTRRMPIKLATVKGTITSRFSAKLAPVNLKAFDLGYERCQQALKKG